MKYPNIRPVDLSQRLGNEKQRCKRCSSFLLAPNLKKRISEIMRNR